MISFGDDRIYLVCVDFNNRVAVFCAIMLKGVLLFLIALAGCNADTPAAPTQGILCGETPNRIFQCFGNPKIVAREDITRKCHQGRSSECDRITCIFTESGWLENDKVNKKKVAEFFDQFASDHSSWAPAVTHLKAACLGEHDLPAQGVYLNCPAYDIVHCSLTSFIRNALPSQWKTTPECEYPRAFAGACPVCPDSCFATQVPYGTCNACATLPRSV